ncbi:MAG: right-handed parallel beta-helix repeat-containing protein [Planctomycetia bacterium]|nr:right-handed parallel beta-helix repeat-containing protein [Planctomycetia bacterium]
MSSAAASPTAEWLTDYGNLRSNGYIPVGTTAQQMGPFIGNSLLCQNGINAGLAGADLEVGAYIPGLADWAGMVSVGGYAFGNARYNNVNGTDLVPYFGGVYTRMDLTLVRNWDFSLQANNDSFFDWTGFARLTYRMGGSRRRNVPDQMEQPMMRNEHVVRAHQAPVQAINAMTGLPYEVFHVDNTTTTLPAGTGTWENPFTTLQQAQTAATADYDMVFVHIGQSATCPYETPVAGYQFQANNQYLIGEGTSLKLCTANCGLIDVWSNTASSLYPVITNTQPGEAAIVLTNAAGTTSGATVDHVRITGSPIGISDGVGLPASSPTTGPGTSTVNDVQIYGNGPGQRGVLIQDLAGNSGTLNFSKMNLQNLTNDGIVVSTGAGGNPNVNISNSTINNTAGSGVFVANLNDTGRVQIVGSTITNSTQAGVYVGNGNAYIGTSTFSKNALAGVYVQDNDPTVSAPTPGISTVQVTNSTFQENPVGIWGIANSGTTNMTITNNTITTNSSPVGANGVILAVGSLTGSGTTGVLNGAVIGNSITPVIATTVVDTATTTTTTGTTTSTTTTYSSIGNILLSTAGKPIFDATTGDVTGFISYGTLNIKAADQPQLQSMNRNAGVALLPVPVLSGSSQYYVIPPPPTFDASLVVPLPNP